MTDFFSYLTTDELPKNASATAILLFGFVLGLKHAVEADHLAAVTTIVSERKNVLSASIIGGLWGIGHTISLLVVGALIILIKLQINETTTAQIENISAYLEAAVGAMLVILGLNVLRKIISGKEKIHVHEHSHGSLTHTHLHRHKTEMAEESHHFARFNPRSVLIGMIHGLAGSAALMLFVVPAIDSPALALLYILIFGIGSIGGMMAMSFLIGLPFHFSAKKLMGLNKAIRLAAGIFSFGLGLFIIYEKLFAVS